MASVSLDSGLGQRVSLRHSHNKTSGYFLVFRIEAFFLGRIEYYGTNTTNWDPSPRTLFSWKEEAAHFHPLLGSS